MDIKKLDTVFSEYIRRRDADEYGRVKCCTCDTVAHWSEMDCGHWIMRRHTATRWSEENCHPQCKSCNRHFDGQWVKHRDYIFKRHGPDMIWKLGHLRIQPIKLMQHEIDEMVQVYKEKIKQLDNQ